MSRYGDLIPMVPWLAADEESAGQKVVNLWLAPRIARKRVLYVGVGNSAFVNLFPKTADVLSITLMKQEYEHAIEKGLACRRMDKYTPELRDIPRGFDYIVDVNPFSYALSLDEANRIVEDYYWLLGVGGALVTHAIGLRWRWKPLPPIAPNAHISPQVLSLEWCRRMFAARFHWFDHDGDIIELRQK